MAKITCDSIVSDGKGTWTFTWSYSELPDAEHSTVRVVLWGDTIDAVNIVDINDGTYTFTGAVGYKVFPPPLEFISGVDFAVSELESCTLLMQWYRVECSRYSIRQYIGTEFQEIGYVPNSTIVDLMSFETTVLADQAVHSWRVVPISEKEREGDPLQWNATIIRPPDPLKSTLLYVMNDGLLTISQ